MTTASTTSATDSAGLLVGETVHYRDHDRCWAAAVVDAAPGDTAQLYVFPLPPTVPMAANPGTFVGHDGGTTNETWHRLDECGTTTGRPSRRSRARRRKGER
ncbi:MAG TPA: hypothetical protein VFM03_07705 [Candidatus Limnocylindria bacterium]|jgi:hypothetical protein|nr:hypothetical protein [Candidatus Limnocylindria bacterium]